MRRRFPKTATPPRVSLRVDILEDRLPVSEQIGTLIGVILLTGGEPPACRQARDMDFNAPFGSGLDGTPARTAAPLDVVPSERIALVPATATPAAPAPNLAEQPAWRTNSLSPTLLADPESDPLELSLPRIPVHPVWSLLADGPGGQRWQDAIGGGGQAGVAPDAGSGQRLTLGNPDLQGGKTAGLDLQDAAAAALRQLQPASATAAGPLAVNPNNQGNSNPPPSGGPHFPPRRAPHRSKDPVNVLDANNAIVLDPNVIKHDYATYTVTLYAQVSGATVQSYTWSWDNSTDYTNLTGQGTYKLNFQWNSFTGIHAHTISLQTTNVGGGGETLTFPFLVYGTDSPAYTPSQPTTSGNWPTILQPDAIKPDQDTVDSQFYSVGLDTGALMIDHALPTYNADIAPLDLVYDSTAADRQPIFITHYQIDPNRTDTPTSVVATLSITGGTGSSTTYTTTGAGQVNPGDVMEIALQGNMAGAATGRYSGQVSITAHYAGTGEFVSYPFTFSVLDPSATIFGHGWSLGNVERLWPVTGGAILEMPGGQSLWFASAGGNAFTTPPGDFSTLALTTGYYYRTMPDGTQIDFDSTTGKQLSVTDRNGNVTSFGYDGTTGNLLTITDYNGQVVSFGYTGNEATTITIPNNRTATLIYDNGSSGRLIAIQGPHPGGGAANIPVFTFNYDTSDHITTLQDPRSYTTNFGYTSNRVTTVTRADGVQEAYSPLQLQGLNTVVLAAETQATYTDGETNQWLSRYDWLGFGRPTQQQDPRTDVTAVTIQQRDANGLPWMSADPLARRTRTQYDSLGNPTTIGLADDTLELYTYNSFSQPLTYTAPYPPANPPNPQVITTFVRDTHGNLLGLVEPKNSMYDTPPAYTFTYYNGGWLRSVEDPNYPSSGLISYSYDPTIKDRLLAITYPFDSATNSYPNVSLSYDRNGNVIGSTDENGNITTYAFDKLNRLTQVILPTQSNPVYTVVYDTVGNTTEEIDPPTATSPSGRITTGTYNALNDLVTQVDPLSHTWSFYYDGTENLIGIQDPLGHTNTFSYDPANNWVGKTDPLNDSTVIGVDAAGQQTSVTDPLNHTWNYAYNARGWLIQEIDPTISSTGLRNQSTFGYDSRGNQTSVTEVEATAIPGNPQTANWSFGYDNRDEQTSYVDNHGYTTNYQYTPLGDLSSETGPVAGSYSCDCPCSCRPSSQTFDNRNRVVGSADQAGNTFTGGYDKANNLTLTQRPNTGLAGVKDAKTFSHDQIDRPTGVETSPTGTGGQSFAAHYTTFGYDNSGRLTSVVDSGTLNNTTGYFYDDADRLWYTQDPNGLYTTYSYDAANRLVSIVDRRGLTQTFGYDNADRLTSEIWLNTSSQPIWEMTYSYDAADRMTAAADPNAAYTFSYDEANRLIGVGSSFGTNNPQVQLTYTYDGFGNRGQVLDNLGGVISYGYDLAHYLTTMSWYTNTTSLIGQITLSYDSMNRLKEIDRIAPNGNEVTSTMAYNANDLVTNISDYSTGGVNVSFNYGYDADNRVDTYQGPDGNLSYTYDYTDQLTQVSGYRGETYGYDLNGNRTSANGVSYREAATGNRLTFDGVFTYVYDQDGNLLSKFGMVNGVQTTFAYTWDNRDRLTSVSITGYTTVNDSFLYDLFDRRIETIVPAPGQLPTVKTWTVYDGANPYADFSGTTLTRRYLYGDAVDELFARYNTTTLSWYLTDNVGSVREIANTSGGDIDDIQYNSYGQILSESQPGNGDRFKFTGREWNAEIGLYYYRERYYDPNSGGFISEDPTGFDSGEMNLYRYTGNSPIGNNDPLGLWPPLFGGGGLPNGTMSPPFRKWLAKKQKQQCIDSYAKLRVIVFPKSKDSPGDRKVVDGHLNDLPRFGKTQIPSQDFDSPEDLAKWLEENYPPGSIDELVISGHGYPGGMNFGHGGDFSLPGPGNKNPGNPDTLKRIAERVSPNGTIILAGCNTGGEKGKPLQNLANQLHRKVRGTPDANVGLEDPFGRWFTVRPTK